MASGSKKVSNVPLSKEEQEEEELRNELINSRCGFFYDGISIDEMKMILNELKKSKEIDSQNKEPVPTSSPPNESISSQNSSQPLNSDLEKSIPTFSYRQAVISGDLSTIPSSNEDTFNSREKSPDPTLKKGYGKNLNNSENNSHDSESIFENNSNINNDDYPQLGNKSNLKSNSYENSSTRVLRPREAKKPSSAMIKKANLERWRLDPFQFLEDDDVPLKTPEHVHTHQEEYLPYSTEKVDDETFDALCRQMSEKLDSLHELMIARENQTIWGSPIKVGKRNSKADKNSLAEKTPASSSRTPDVSIRDTTERSSKRKALTIIAAATQNDSTDEISDEEFVNTKKRKFQQEIKAEEVPKKIREGQENKSNSDPIGMIEINPTEDFSDSLFDHSDLTSLQRLRVKRTNISDNPDSIGNQLYYPRRVTPPNPGKKSFKGPRCRNKNSTNSQSTSKKTSDSLDDSEISKILNGPDQMDDSDCIEITDEIKPSTNPKGIKKKLSMAHSHLENKKTAIEQKIKAEEESRKQKELEERLRKDELICRRFQEQEDERSRLLEIERKLNEQELLYKNILGPQKRITRSNFNINIPRNYEEMNEDQLLADDDDDEIILTDNNTVTKSCPICQKSFPTDQIASHASECNLFPSESNDVHSVQPSTSYSRRDNIYECGICNKYRTYDGKIYEEHVTKCREKAEDQRINGIKILT